MSVKFEVSRAFSHPPGEVFRVLVDLDRAEEWVPGLVHLERADEGPLGPQSRWRETRRFLGKEATEEFEVTSFGPPSVFAVRARGGREGSAPGEYHFRYRLVPEDSGTRVTVQGEVRGLTGIANWLSQLFTRRYRAALERDLHALEEFLDREAEAT